MTTLRTNFPVQDVNTLDQMMGSFCWPWYPFYDILLLLWIINQLNTIKLNILWLLFNYCVNLRPPSSSTLPWLLRGDHSVQSGRGSTGGLQPNTQTNTHTHNQTKNTETDTNLIQCVCGWCGACACAHTHCIRYHCITPLVPIYTYPYIIKARCTDILCVFYTHMKQLHQLHHKFSSNKYN